MACIVNRSVDKNLYMFSHSNFPLPRTDGHRAAMRLSSHTLPFCSHTLRLNCELSRERSLIQYRQIMYSSFPSHSLFFHHTHTFFPPLSAYFGLPVLSSVQTASSRGQRSDTAMPRIEPDGRLLCGYLPLPHNPWSLLFSYLGLYVWHANG